MSLYETLKQVHLVRALYVVSELDIPRMLQERPRTIEELANTTGSKRDLLYRIMRVLVIHGYFEKSGSKYLLTGEGENLAFLRPWVLTEGSPNSWAAYGRALDIVKGNAPHETEFYDPKENFVYGMSRFTELQAKQLVASFNFSPYKKIVDVGGGRGALIKEILTQYPRAEGVLFDRPISIVNADAGRAKLVPGNFFESIPEGADLYVIKTVLRDWNDKNAAKILNNCKGDNVLVIDAIFDEKDKTLALSDLSLMFWLGGTIRTRQQWDALFTKTPFKIQRISRGNPYLMWMKLVRG